MTDQEIKRNSGFLVCAKRCSECLFSSARIVPQARAGEVIKECLEADRFFVCHKHDICCRGFFDEFADQIWPIRLAKILNGIIFVEEGSPIESLDRSEDE